ncbi:oxalate:formate antiporter-like [Physella acuta]|uniref:oxalate:formate antiporter-like n=1 Tax=Physella acuta TaxID=109671 RepID=UPI0027DD6264|nr:oxalate:formate antiporter-like [Physella acuta]
MRVNGTAPSLTYTECAWILATAGIGQGLSVVLGGLIEKKIGPKLTTLCGGWCMSLGVLSTYFSIKQSFGLCIFTYGAVFGFGIGIAYAVPLSCSVRWFPERKGLANGLVLAGFGGGAFIFTQIQTAFINPDNKKPELEVDGDKYFAQPDILDRVPYTFLLIGGCYAVLQLIGSLLICNPPPKEITIIIPSSDDTTKASLPEERYVKLPDQLPALELQPKVDPTALDEKKSQADEEEQIDNVISEKSASDDQDDHNVYPLKMLKDKNFYLLWIIFLFNGQGVTFISSLYKAYGQTFISDDSFLALVGAFAAVFNASGRIVWGVIADKFSFRVALLALLGVFTSLMLTLQVSEYGGKPLFFVYICLLFGSFSGNFSLFPTATAKSYGPKYLSINYGLLFTSQLVTAPLGTFLSQMLKASIGWNGLFFLVAGFTFSSLLLTILFSGKDKKGNTI